MKCCGTCRHYKEVDARGAMFDPDCIYHMCTWQPVQPDWIQPPYLRGQAVAMEAIRKPTDGTACPVYWEKP